jgi:hypothetical protein
VGESLQEVYMDLLALPHFSMVPLPPLSRETVTELCAAFFKVRRLPPALRAGQR